jgi:hypothetical protein
LEGFFERCCDVVGVTLGGLGPFGDLRPFAADADLLRLSRSPWNFAVAIGDQ